MCLSFYATEVLCLQHVSWQMYLSILFVVINKWDRANLFLLFICMAGTTVGPQIISNRQGLKKEYEAAVVNFVTQQWYMSSRSQYALRDLAVCPFYAHPFSFFPLSNVTLGTL